MRKTILTVSAIFYAITGIACSFLPQELSAHLGASRDAAVAIQLMGAALMGFAILNWSLRGSLVGGIYNRPAALGNLLHSFAAGMALIKARHGDPVLLFLTVSYCAIAIAFAWMLFTSPVTRPANETSH